MSMTESRRLLAVEVILTSGLLAFDDIQNGLLADGLQGIPEVAAVALNVLVGGLDGCTATQMLDASKDPAIASAVEEVLWTAIAQTLADNAEAI